MKERLREWIDIPDRATIVVGAGGLVLSAFYPPALVPSLLLIIVGNVGLGATQAVWPKKQHTA